MTNNFLYALELFLAVAFIEISPLLIIGIIALFAFLLKNIWNGW